MRPRFTRVRGFVVRLAAAAMVLGLATTAVVEEASWRAAPESYFELMYANGGCLMPNVKDKFSLTTGWSTGLDFWSCHAWFFDATDASDFTASLHMPRCGFDPGVTRKELLRTFESRPRVTMSQATGRMGLCSLQCTSQLSEDDGKARVEAVTTGWPMRCVSRESRDGVRDLPHSGLARLRQVCLLEETLVSMFNKPTSLIYYPKSGVLMHAGQAARLWIFPVGVLADTAFFGSAWFGVMLAVRGLRRWWLIRRGRCVACGYQVDDLPRCPECGAERATGRTGEQADVATNG